MSVRSVIENKFYEVLEQTDSELSVDTLTNEVVLLQSGLDSLGFAILVASLEEELGYDPFTMMDEPVYPTTFGEFVDIYDRMNPGA